MPQTRAPGEPEGRRVWAGLFGTDEAGGWLAVGMLADPIRSRFRLPCRPTGSCAGDLALAPAATEDQVSYALKSPAGLPVSFRKDGRMVLPSQRRTPAPAVEHRRAAAEHRGPRPTMSARRDGRACPGWVDDLQVTWSLISVTRSGGGPGGGPAGDRDRRIGGTGPRRWRSPLGWRVVLLRPRSWRWPGRCCGGAPASPPRWRSRSPAPTWSSSWHHPGPAALPAVHAGRVRRRADHDRGGCGIFRCSSGPADRRGPAAG